MASRTVWKGFIQFSLVSVPVKAYTATSSGGGKISLNQLHKDCNSRINYKKTCPVHGELQSDQIVSGYEFSSGKFVVVDADELEKIRTPKEKAINIEGFIDAETIDPRYFSGKTWYLTPDGPIGQKPYTLIRRVMTDSGRVAFARAAVGGRQQLMLLRPMGDLLVASMLSYEQELKKPDEFKDELVKVEVDPKELQLAKTLTDTLVVKNFDIGAYTDDYTEKLTALIEAKVQGRQVVEPPAEEMPQVVNLMEALERSLVQAKKKAPAAAAKPPKLAAPSSAETRGAATQRKRKTS